MVCVIIKKKDLDRLGKELLKEVYNFINDEYCFNVLKEDFYREGKFINYKDYCNKIGKDFNIEEKFNEFINLVRDAYKDECIDTEKIYHIICEFELDDETDGDLYYKKEAFLDLFRVFETGYTYLED